jgi:hypothetical protein
MIKEFTPLLGYIFWSSFQWIIFINAQSVKINALQFSKFKIDGFNGSRMSKNPSLGSSCTWFGQKLRRNHFLEVSPNSLLSLLAKMHLCVINLAHECFPCQKPSTAPIPQLVANCCTIRGLGTFSGGGYGRMPPMWPCLSTITRPCWLTVWEVHA